MVAESDEGHQQSQRSSGQEVASDFENAEVDMAIWDRRGSGLSKARAVATAAMIQVFFLLRISDFGARDSRTVSEFILGVHQVKFWKAGVRCTWSGEPGEVSIEGDGGKMSTQPWYRNHFATGSELYPVRALAEWFCLVDGKEAGGCPLFTVPPESSDRVQQGEGANSLCMTCSDVCGAIKAAAVASGDKAASYSSHSDGLEVQRCCCKQEPR